MKLYVIKHKKRPLSTFIRIEDAQQVQVMLSSLGVKTSIHAKGAAYRTWPTGNTPLLLLVLGNQTTSNTKRTRVVGHVLLNVLDTIVNVFKSIAKLHKGKVKFN